MKKEFLGTRATMFTPTYTGDDDDQLKRLKSWLKANPQKKSYVYKNNIEGVTNPIPDPYSSDVYNWIDLQVEKAIKRGFLKIPGKHPPKAKKLGVKVEGELYGGLKQAVNKYLDNLNPGMTQTEVLAGIEDVVQQWVNTQVAQNEKIFEQLYNVGFMAGTAAAGVKPTLRIADKLAIEWLKRNPDRLGANIRIFGAETVDKFRSIIAESFSPEGSFSVPELFDKMGEVVDAERYKLERIVRTEVAGVSGIGRLLGWAKDPDRYMYEYLWINPFSF